MYSTKTVEIMKKSLVPALLMMMAACSPVDRSINSSSLRAPAYPLVTIDPYQSIWSAADALTQRATTHWTGVDMPLNGTVTVDGQCYRWMGNTSVYLEALAPISDSARGWSGRYSLQPQRGLEWTGLGFDDSSWLEGEAMFGDRLEARTRWAGGEIAIRRRFTLCDLDPKSKYVIRYNTKNHAWIYLNGTLVLETGDGSYSNREIELSEELGSLLREGENVVAVRCTCPMGNRSKADVGVYRVAEEDFEIESRAARQLSAQVQATQTHYSFECGPVRLDVSFRAPVYDLRDLERISRPVNTISYRTHWLDGKRHDVKVEVSAGAACALHERGSQEFVHERFRRGNLEYESFASKAQDTLGRKGDAVRIDWGTFYLATSTRNDSREGHFHVGYDDGVSVRYFEHDLLPYWNRTGQKSIFDMFDEAERDYRKDMEGCYRFDRELMQRAQSVGGRRYAELAALSYRQCIAAHKLVELPNGDIALFSKENDSNGSIGTVDVTYPSSPLMLCFNPRLSEALMNHIFDYSESGRWTKPFPAHDVGTYPHATGQTYPYDMPVEEAGNMIIQTAATCLRSGDWSYARAHWETLGVWSEYLLGHGLDPENQICTDDFAGHFAHNANLSVKAIVALGSYALMARALGETEIWGKYDSVAREWAREWEKMACEEDHTRLTFDNAEGWSLKYNLVWDRVLGLGFFSGEMIEREVKWYMRMANRYGVPLDSRADYTKSDWIVWSAALACDRADFEQIIAPLWDFCNETPDRVPMSDWYFTSSGTYRAFKARSVVGGFFMPMLLQD